MARSFSKPLVFGITLYSSSPAAGPENYLSAPDCGFAVEYKRDGLRKSCHVRSYGINQYLENDPSPRLPGYRKGSGDIQIFYLGFRRIGGLLLANGISLRLVIRHSNTLELL